MMQDVRFEQSTLEDLGHHRLYCIHLLSACMYVRVDASMKKRRCDCVDRVLWSREMQDVRQKRLII